MLSIQIGQNIEGSLLDTKTKKGLSDRGSYIGAISYLHLGVCAISFLSFFLFLPDKVRHATFYEENSKRGRVA